MAFRRGLATDSAIALMQQDCLYQIIQFWGRNWMSKWHLNIWVLLTSAVAVLGWVQPSVAEVIPDVTLPTGERSQVTGNPNFQIDGGARRGGNLFHSFSQFSVPTDGSAFFNNAAGIQNIFSRITGGSVSEIDGVIRANGTANLFLLNPNGILFGPNAALNIGGSFVATTADAIGFPNGEVFSSDIAQPLPNQLLSINPNALFFNQPTPQPIVNQSIFNEQGLQVLPRQNLLLVGGEIQLDSGRLISPGSHVELGSVGEVGIVGLSTVRENWRLNIPDEVTRADVFLRNGSPDVSVEGDSGSSIRILAQNIEVFGGSLRVGVLRDTGSPNAPTGDLELNATGSITISNTPVTNILAGQGNTGSIYLTAGDRITILGNRLLSTAEPGSSGNTGNITISAGTILFDGTLLISNTSQQTDASDIFINARDRVLFNNSFVYNTVEPTGTGNGGNININTGSLALTENAQLILFTAGRGDVGNLNINARDTVLSEDSAVFNYVEPTGIGNGGDINITTESLAFTENARMLLSTLGQGDSGSVNINARDTVLMEGGQISNTVGSTAIGNAGGINITTGALTLTNGAQMVAGTSGQGNASNITINARDRVSLDGESSDGTIASTIFTRVEPGAVGQGGAVNITTGSLFLTNGGAINTANVGGTGNSGRVTIEARNAIQIRGTAPVQTTNRSGIFTSATEGSTGNGGDVIITTGSLSVSDRGRIITNAEGQGRAGNIRIQARDTVSFNGGDAVSTLDRDATGRGGDIGIAARSLTLLNGAQLSTSTRGRGDAGNVTVDARDTVLLDGANRVSASAINTRVDAGAIGIGGQIEITADSVSLINGAQLATTTLGQGRAGNISINARERVAISGTDANYTSRVPQPDDEIDAISAGPASGLYANTEPNSIGRGGSIRIATGELTVEAGGRLAASTSGRGDAGNIRVRATDAVMLSGTSSFGFSSGLLTNTENTSTGRGGSIRIDTDTLRVEEGAVLSARSSSAQRGGEIIVNAETIDLTGGGQLLTTAFSSGQAGSITVNAGDRLHIAGSDSTFDARLARFGRTTVDPVSAASGLFTNTAVNSSGAGGAIALTTGFLSLLNGGRLVSSTAGQGDAGDITVNSSNLRLSGASSGLFAQTTTDANAGNLRIQPQGDGQSITVQLQEGAQISASTSGGGRGGALTITAPESITLTGNGSIISAETSGRGAGGNLNLQTGTLNIQDQAEVTVSSSGRGRAGSLFVDAGQIFLNNQGRIRADTAGGGGNINLRSPLILLRNGGNITTNATGSNIPGGNIAINTQFLIAVPNEDSNISANSENFRGGNISINASGILGIQPRLAPTPLSDITATGANAALDGTIALTLTGTDPTPGLVELPTDLVDSSQLIAQGCPADEGNSFVISGRGGLPPNLEQQLDDDAGWQDRRRLTVTQQRDEGEGRGDIETRGRGEFVANPLHVPNIPLTEATGWQTTSTGEVLLMAITPEPVVQNSSNQPATCSRGNTERSNPNPLFP
ncbi:filamentous hemagglutinin N-terminal domain-containing protein [Leptolyngbya sp. FACHB-541]|uniref:two-partner secretion domain-containing protein n=1 Tax=Leptolyngbya sp. FACHB-541 TaxID=2692810 RepID=UPI0016824D44|nr:filamentous hemagglutinin N-terminal domain-containing protein [Leptolyngbya sp. FACHB-541]MBD1997867.1 filamentous hemagglutinin N-terminal domain-containing protein [Leptolyngbya sp. FACHB-541]